jgi:hypothetical protein
MRGKGWIREIVSHFLILSILGGGLVFLYKKASQIPLLTSLSYFKPVFIVAFSLLGLMVLIFAFQLFSSVRLERFSPGNPGSLKRLEGIRRFRLPRHYVQLQETWPAYRADFLERYKEKGWKDLGGQPFEAVMARKRSLPSFGRPPLVDRLFIFYHPMMNVIIVDQILKECERLIEADYDRLPARRNRLVFLTDMKNRDEVTSAGAGVVNYLCTPLHKVSLYPVLVDMDAGRFFYPLDTSLAKSRHRFHYWRCRLALRAWIKRKAKETSSKHPQETSA